MTEPAHRVATLYRNTLHYILRNGYATSANPIRVAPRRAETEQLIHALMDKLIASIDSSDNDGEVFFKENHLMMRYGFDAVLFHSTFTRTENPEVFALGDVFDRFGGGEFDEVLAALQAVSDLSVAPA